MKANNCHTPWSCYNVLWPCRCFLSHPGVFWGAFLAPILLIMVFNLVLFIWVIVVMVRHIRRKTKNKLGPRKVIEIIIRLSGVMFLFGLTWLFAVLTVVSVHGLRETYSRYSSSSLIHFRVPLFSCFSVYSTRRLEILGEISFKRRPGCYHHPMSVMFTKWTQSKALNWIQDHRNTLFLHHSAQELNPPARLMTKMD